MKEKVLIYGGTFNPPTNAHQEIIRRCLALDEFNELWVMPSGDRIDKDKMAADKHRLAMLRLLKHERFADDKRFIISDFELKLPRPNQTYITVGALAINYPSNEFWFIYGADAYKNMPRWHSGEKLRRSLNMVIFERDGTVVPPADNIISMGNGIEGMSSSTVREAVSNNMPVNAFVCAGVRQYIDRNKLYL